ATHETDGRLDVGLVERLDSELARQPGEELVEGRVRDRSAQLRIDLGVDRLRVEETLDEPGRRAVRKALQLGDTEGEPLHELRQHRGVPEAGPALERAACPLEAPLPAVRARERGCAVG